MTITDEKLTRWEAFYAKQHPHDNAVLALIVEVRRLREQRKPEDWISDEQSKQLFIDMRKEAIWAINRIAELEAEVVKWEAFAQDTEDRITELETQRSDVAVAIIHAHEDFVGGVRYDEMAGAVKTLGKRIAKLEAKNATRPTTPEDL